MAKKVNIAIKKEAPAHSGDCPEPSPSPSLNDSIEQTVQSIEEAIEVYLEALAAQERENRLSR